MWSFASLLVETATLVLVDAEVAGAVEAAVIEDALPELADDIMAEVAAPALETEGEAGTAALVTLAADGAGVAMTEAAGAAEETEDIADIAAEETEGIADVGAFVVQ